MDFVLNFGFEAIPIQVAISLPLWIKLTMVQLFLLFLCFFSYAGGALVSKQPTFIRCYWFINFGYSENYNTQKAFVIIFLICSDLLNCLRSVGTIVITREWLKKPQSHFYWAIHLKSHHFSLFWYILCTATPDISSSSKNINNATRVKTISFDY